MLREFLFQSFFLGGFECSTHARENGKRLDLIAATAHDRFAEQDYRRLVETGIFSCRDGLRWHLIEARAGHFDFSCALPLVKAAQKTGMQVIWDLLHYGWPEHIDVFDSRFVDAFGRFCGAAARFIASETDVEPWFTVVNEPSFLCWAGAEVGFFPPFCYGRGDEFKKQLIRATIAGIEAVRDEIPQARFLQVDPLVNIVSDEAASDESRREAEGYCEAQFQCTDMLAGYLCPELGGNLRYLDVIGCNYYVHNQWRYGGKFIERSDPKYRPLHQMLAGVAARYGRPLLIAETGIEDARRPEWLAYVCDEVETALHHGLPVHGVCLYPIVNHPGWADDRHCHNGLWDYCNAEGHREIYSPLAVELKLQQARFNGLTESSGRGWKTEEVYA
ncbi:MAG: beta-glucosidase [Bryobacteraceae bacterium]|nr:beta-glucosidase [Bryobacteraceae bacterium]